MQLTTMFKDLTQKLKSIFEEKNKQDLFHKKFDADLEKSLLGSILICKDLQEKVKSNQLTAKGFVDPLNNKIMLAIEKYLVTDRRPTGIDFNILGKDLFTLFPNDFLDNVFIKTEILNAVSKSSIQYASAMTIIDQNKENKKILELATVKNIDFFSTPSSEVISQIKTIVDEAQSDTLTEVPYYGASGFEFYFNEKTAQMQQTKIELPFQAFQNSNINFGNTHLVTIGGRPKTGKSKFSLQVALATAQTKPTLFFTLEMSKVEIMDQAIAIIGNFNPVIAQNIQNDDDKGKRISEKYGEAYGQAVDSLFDKLGDNFKLVGDKKLTIWDICQIIKEQNKLKKLELVVIDQLSFVHTNGKFKEKFKEYDYIVRELKELCKELKICVVLNVQLNRKAESKEDGVVGLEDIKDASAIEETSDILILMGKSAEDKKSIKDTVPVKFSVTSRHNMGGIQELQFNKKLAKFEDLQFVIQKK